VGKTEAEWGKAAEEKREMDLMEMVVGGVGSRQFTKYFSKEECEKLLWRGNWSRMAGKWERLRKNEEKEYSAQTLELDQGEEQTVKKKKQILGGGNYWNEEKGGGWQLVSSGD